MKHIDIKTIKDPFILELVETFNVTGFKIYAKQEYYVGYPTGKRQESKREMRERWIRFRVLQKREVKK